MARFIDIARRIKKDYSSSIIVSHPTIAGDFECQNIAMHVTHNASALEMFIIRTLEIFKLITRLEIHWLTGLSLVTINKQLEEMREEGYLEYNLPYNQEVLLKNIATLEKSGIILNPSKMAKILKTHQTLKQYQLTVELGKRLLSTGKHDSYKIENLDFSLIQLDQNIVIADVLKALSGSQKDVDSWYYASIEKLLLDNTSIHREKGITLQGFTADTFINYREYTGCTLYELVNSTSYEKFGTAIEQNNKLVVIDNIESKLSPTIPQRDILTSISKKLNKNGIESKSYDIRPINDKFGVDKPENVAIYSIIIREPLVWSLVFKNFPELRTAYFTEFSTIITDSKWEITFNAVFMPDIDNYDSIIEFITKRIQIKYQNTPVVSEKDIIGLLSELIEKLKIFYNDKWTYSPENLIQTILEKEHSNKDKVIVFEEDLIKKDVQQFLEKAIIQSSNSEIVTSRHSKPKAVLLIEDFYKLHEKNIFENTLNQFIFINPKKKINYLIIFIPENTIQAFRSYVFFNMIKDVENKIVTKTELLEKYNKNIDRSLKNISQYTNKYKISLDVSKNHILSSDEIYSHLKGQFKIKIYLFEQEIEKWLKNFKKLSNEELITNYLIITVQNDSYVVLEITQDFINLAKANLKTERSDWLTLFTEPIIKGRVSIVETISRPFYVKIVPNQFSSSIITNLIYLRSFTKIKDLSQINPEKLETIINDYIKEVLENYKLIGKDTQHFTVNKDELLTSIKVLIDSSTSA